MANRRIYLIDDDRFLLDMYAVKFKGAGHDVATFQNPEDALAKLRAGEVPDALLLDIIMPSMTGFEVLETIRRENLGAGKMKVVMLTNQGADTDIDKAKELKADGYIIKASAIPSEVLSETMNIIDKA